jgi:hypothetical protein
MAFVAPGAMAQTTVTTDGGKSQYIPVFVGSHKIDDSAITQSQQNQIGINTGLSVDSQFDPLMAGNVFHDGGGIGMITTVDPAEDNYGWAESNFWLLNKSAPTWMIPLWSVGAEGFYANTGDLTNMDMYISDARTFVYNFAVDGNDNVYIGGQGFGATDTLALYAGANGNVGMGTITPSQRLEVNGNIKLTGTVMPGGGDFAESVDVTGDRTQYKPGDILVIDPSAPGKFLKSAEAYSTLVSGIYSTKPGNVGRRQLTAMSVDEVPMAIVGIVPTNVTADNGAIKPGDLLVTSSTLGYAMKGTDRNKMLGAVIGKALGSLDSGKGVIEVVVTLQ